MSEADINPTRTIQPDGADDFVRHGVETMTGPTDERGLEFVMLAGQPTPVVGRRDMIPRVPKGTQVLFKAMVNQYGHVDPSTIHPAAMDADPAKLHKGAIEPPTKASLRTNMRAIRERSNDTLTATQRKLLVAGGAVSFVLLSGLALSQCGDEEPAASVSSTTEAVTSASYELLPGAEIIEHSVLHADQVTVTNLLCGLLRVSNEDFQATLASTDRFSHFLNVNREAFATLESNIRGERAADILTTFRERFGIGRDGMLYARADDGSIIDSFYAPVLSDNFPTRPAEDPNIKILEVGCSVA